jgi:UDP-galactopyranose mutase
MDLIDAMATAHPEWHIVMVGPVVKIDPAGLPKHPNIHWLGQQSYADLPAFICGWDVCLMPFALNDATRFISPTKMLEYMACGQPAARQGRLAAGGRPDRRGLVPVGRA